LAALAALPPLPRALHDGSGGRLEQLDLAARIERLAVLLEEHRLVVEQVALAGGAGHEQLHDALRFGLVVQAGVEVLDEGGRGGEGALVAEQPRQGDAAEAAAGVPEEGATVEGVGHGGFLRSRKRERRTMKQWNADHADGADLRG